MKKANKMKKVINKMGKNGKKWEKMVNFIYFCAITRNTVMITFIGEYSCKVDEKGRIMLPAAFKKQLPQGLEEKFVIKPDTFEKCLVLYPIPEWKRLEKIIKNRTDPFIQEHERFLRMFFQGSAEITLDGNNRMLIPKRLIEYCNIGKEAILAGRSGKIEIWAKDKFYDISRVSPDFTAQVEKILGGKSNDPEK